MRGSRTAYLTRRPVKDLTSAAANFTPASKPKGRGDGAKSHKIAIAAVRLEHALILESR